MEIFVRVTSFPPCGQLTVIERGQQVIEFTVCLQTKHDLPELPWRVSVWHNVPELIYQDTWKELNLSPSVTVPFDLASPVEPGLRCHFFTGKLDLGPNADVSVRASFTIKYRTGEDSPWQWVKQQLGVQDGSLLRTGEAVAPSHVPWMIDDFDDRYLDDWEVKGVRSETPGASLSRISSKCCIPRKNPENSEYADLAFGSSCGGFCRYMALVRNSASWLAPRHGEEKLHFTENALLCSFLTNDTGQSVVLLPIDGVNDTVNLFKTDSEGRLIVTARNDGIEDQKFEFLAAIADTFELANCAVMYEARKIVLAQAWGPPSSMAQLTIQDDPSNVKVDVKESDKAGPKPQWLEDWFDGLTYCTWNGLGQDLNERKLLAALDGLAANGVHISRLIIDDNWQSLDGIQGEIEQTQRGWMDFEANPVGFPRGLKSTLALIKERHPSIVNIGVWHALTGYWGGISPSGSLAKRYKTIEVSTVPRDSKDQGPDKSLAIDPSDIHRFYNDFYSFLAESGITSVKTDVQSYLDLLSSTPDRRAFITAYQSAWTRAHLRHLSGKAVSCMSHIPQILFHSFLPTNKPRVLLRSSDDYVPEVPAAHPWHVFCNAHNALFIQHLNAVPDWDIFQTSHPYAGFHAAARCISGGPISITDIPGEHDLDLIAQMTAKTIRGQSIILRPSIVGKTIGIYDRYEDRHVLKIGAYNGPSQTGNGILGVYNMADDKVTALIPFTDFPGIQTTSSPPSTTQQQQPFSPSGSYIIRSHIHGLISSPMTSTNANTSSNLLLLSLPVRGYDILSAHPIYTFPPPSSSSPRSNGLKPLSIAILGLLGKMTGVCALTATTSLSSTPNSSSTPRPLHISIGLKALGMLGVWIGDVAGKTVENDILVMLRGRVVPRSRVKIVRDKGGKEKGKRSGVLEVDVLGAWEDMGLEPGWGNEVEVEIMLQL